MIRKKRAVGVVVVLLGAAIMGWRGCAANDPGSRLEGAHRLTPMSESFTHEMPVTKDRGDVADREVLEPEPDEPVAEEIPERYRLPQFSIGMTNGDFLADYWGPQWPEYEGVIRKAGWGDNLEGVNTRDWSEGLPIGTIEDFFEGLLERTMDRFSLIYGKTVYGVPYLWGGRFDEPETMTALVAKSEVFNPGMGRLSVAQRTSLSAFLTDRVVPSKQVADDIMFRWRQLIADDVNQIVAYQKPIHGRVFISPIVSLAWNTQPLKPASDLHPVFDIVLPSVPRDGATSAAGFFSGMLTIWAGSDPTLSFLYDLQVNSNNAFVDDVKEYLAGI